MGKAADTEKIKLRATFFNNIGIALIVTGVFLPLLSLYQQFPTIIVAFLDIVAGNVPLMGLLGAFTTALGGFLFMVVGFYFHHRASKILEEIEG